MEVCSLLNKLFSVIHGTQRITLSKMRVLLFSQADGWNHVFGHDRSEFFPALCMPSLFWLKKTKIQILESCISCCVLQGLAHGKAAEGL